MKITKAEYREAADYFQRRAETALAGIKSLPLNQPEADRRANEITRKESKMCFIAEQACRKSAEFLP